MPYRMQSLNMQAAATSKNSPLLIAYEAAASGYTLPPNEKYEYRAASRLCKSRLYCDRLHVCDPVYGDNLLAQDCLTASGKIPYEDVIPSVLPLQRSHGNCFITIEFSGGSPGRNAFPITTLHPFQGFSEVLIRACVQGGSGLGPGLGGFTTVLFSSIVDWSQVDALADGGWYRPPPVNQVFYTVTVSGTRRLFNPGNNDPAVPHMLAGEPPSAATLKNPNAPSQAARERFWDQRSKSMSPGGTTPWWAPPPSSNSMVYECDSKLGAPSTVDCAHLQWDELGPLSDTVSVSAGTVQFFHSNTCYLAIAASISTILTWAQIVAAVEALVNQCIQTPFNAPQGGRAYYQSPSSQILGREKNKRKRYEDVTGLNALPPGTNITMFQQIEDWISDTVELKSCAWLAVLHGASVLACPG